MLPREASVVSADHFRHLLIARLEGAAAQGGTKIVVTSGELCQSVRFGSHWTDACCEAMQAEIKPGDVVLVEPTRGAGMTVRYQLPRIRERTADAAGEGPPKVLGASITDSRRIALGRTALNRGLQQGSQEQLCWVDVSLALRGPTRSLSI